MKKMYVAILVFLVVLGCDGNNKSSNKEMPQVNNIIYSGLVEGCKAHYDPRYCPDWYKPGVTNAGEQSILIDGNGSEVILSKDQRKAIQDILNKDK